MNFTVFLTESHVQSFQTWVMVTWVEDKRCLSMLPSQSQKVCFFRQLSTYIVLV